MPSAHPAIGFQAVILCGPGTSLYPFTGADDLPKALLPIANKPMLQYPLEWCEKAGFDSILILTLTEHHPYILSFLRSHRLSKSPSGPYIQTEPASSLNDNLGTADILRIAYKKGWIKTDFAVLPCDLVTNLDGQDVAQLWMVEQAGFDGDMGLRARNPKVGADDDGRRGALGVWYETRGEGAVKGQETDFLMLAPMGNAARAGKVGDTAAAAGVLSQLLLSTPGDQMKEAGQQQQGVPVRRSMLKRHPMARMYATRRDSGVYFFPFWVLRFIERNPRMGSIREDVLPWWAKACWQNRRLAERLGMVEILTGGSGGGGGGGDDESDDGRSERYEVGGMSTTRRRPPAPAAAPPVKIPTITAYLPSSSTTFTRRVDTVPLYLFTSLHLAKLDSTPKIDASASVSPSARITGSDCLVADKVSVGDKAIIRRSVLGSGVSIGRNVRLTGCVLMDGASVGEGARLEGCTVGRKAVVGVKAWLRDCEVAEGYVVEEGAEARNERFVVFTGLDADASGMDTEGAYGEDGDEDEEEEGEDREDGGDGGNGEDGESEEESSPLTVKATE